MLRRTDFSWRLHLRRCGCNKIVSVRQPHRTTAYATPKQITNVLFRPTEIASFFVSFGFAMSNHLEPEMIFAIGSYSSSFDRPHLISFDRAAILFDTSNWSQPSHKSSDVTFRVSIECQMSKIRFDVDRRTDRSAQKSGNHRNELVRTGQMWYRGRQVYLRPASRTFSSVIPVDYDVSTAHQGNTFLPLPCIHSFIYSFTFDNTHVTLLSYHVL